MKSEYDESHHSPQPSIIYLSGPIQLIESVNHIQYVLMKGPGVQKFEILDELE